MITTLYKLEEVIFMYALYFQYIKDMTAHENAVCNYVDDVCSGDTECALGERCIVSKENIFNKVCIKICFYDAHCLGKH